MNKQNVLMIFSLGLEDCKSGIPVFNQTLENVLESLNIQTIRVRPKLFSNRSLSIWAYIERCMTSALLNKRELNTLVQYGNFFDILMLPILSMFSKKLYCIMHVGPMWKHLKSPVMNRISQFILNRYCNKLFCISGTQTTLLNHVSRQYRISTIIDERFFTTPKPTIVRDYYLFLGRVSKDKGIDSLLMGFNKLFANTQVKLKIAGGFSDNKYEKHLKEYVKTNGLDKQVEFLGPVTAVDKKIKLIDNAIALIYPSFYDAFPLVPIESFARGKICLCSNISESKEFIEVKDLLFDPTNKKEFQAKWLHLHENIDQLESAAAGVCKKTEQYKPDTLVSHLQQHKVF